MSKDFDLIRKSYDAWNRDDVDAWLETLYPDGELLISGMFPDFDPVYRGREGLVEFRRQRHEPWETFRIDVDQTDERGDCFVMALEISRHRRRQRSGGRHAIRPCDPHA